MVQHGLEKMQRAKSVIQKHTATLVEAERPRRDPGRHYHRCQCPVHRRIAAPRPRAAAAAARLARSPSDRVGGTDLLDRAARTRRRRPGPLPRSLLRIERHCRERDELADESGGAASDVGDGFEVFRRTALGVRRRCDALGARRASVGRARTERSRRDLGYDDANLARLEARVKPFGFGILTYAINSRTTFPCTSVRRKSRPAWR